MSAKGYAAHSATTSQAAHEVFLVNDPNALAARAGSFDLIVDTVSAPHDLRGLLLTLRGDGTMVLVGVPPEAPQVPPGALIFGRWSLAGSLIGGIRETQEMLD